MCEDCRINADYNWMEGGEDPGIPECERTIIMLRARIIELEEALSLTKQVVSYASTGYHMMATDQEWHDLLRRAHEAAKEAT